MPATQSAATLELILDRASAARAEAEAALLELRALEDHCSPAARQLVARARNAARAATRAEDCEPCAHTFHCSHWAATYYAATLELVA